MNFDFYFLTFFFLFFLSPFYFELLDYVSYLMWQILPSFFFSFILYYVCVKLYIVCCFFPFFLFFHFSRLAPKHGPILFIFVVNIISQTAQSTQIFRIRELNKGRLPIEADALPTDLIRVPFKLAFKLFNLDICPILIYVIYKHPLSRL